MLRWLVNGAESEYREHRGKDSMSDLKSPLFDSGPIPVIYTTSHHETEQRVTNATYSQKRER